MMIFVSTRSDNYFRRGEGGPTPPPLKMALWFWGEERNGLLKRELHEKLQEYPDISKLIEKYIQ